MPRAFIRNKSENPESVCVALTPGIGADMRKFGEGIEEAGAGVGVGVGCSCNWWGEDLRGCWRGRVSALSICANYDGGGCSRNLVVRFSSVNRWRA